MLKYLKKIFGVSDLKFYELPYRKSNFATPTRSSKGVGFTVPTKVCTEQLERVYTVENVKELKIKTIGFFPTKK